MSNETLDIVNGFEWRESGGYRWVWSKVGRTLVRITCPFCDTDIEAFLWSLSGSGKRCHCCGAIIGRTHARRKVTTDGGTRP